jgi:uncharacterized FlaG/YvyC family protein
MMDMYPYYERTSVLEKVMGSNLDKINKSDLIGSRDPVIEPDIKKRESGHEHKEKQNDEAGDHFESLKETADLVNRDLEQKNSPYRFYIYQEHEEIYINLVRLDGEGSVVEVKKKNITHQEFTDLIRQIQDGEGLFFDSIG